MRMRIFMVRVKSGWFRMDKVVISIEVELSIRVRIYGECEEKGVV